jgi:hypothetical protein
MRSAPVLSAIRNHRGQIILFVMFSLMFLLVVAGGLGSDVAKLVAAKQEAQSAVDAGALAGAGKLGFDSSVFPIARDFAVNYAQSNKTRTGTVALNRNDANDPSVFDAAPTSTPIGDVLLGIWDPGKPDGIGAGKRFEPSLDGTVVNAVMCRYKKQITGNFLSLLGGIFPLNVAASAVATSNPPLNPPPDTCVFPIGVSDCPFRGNTSLGCGTVITLSTSSGGVPLTTSGGNTAAWLSLNSQPPSAENISQQIADAVNGTCNNPTEPSLDTNGGVVQSAYRDLYDLYPAKYNASDILTVTKPNPDGGAPVTAYEGKGWAVAVPVLNTGSCNADGSVQGNINETYPIVGWTRMVITQVIDRGSCAVVNAADTNSAALCEALRAGTPIPGLNNPSQLRAVFGYYECVVNPSPPRPTPGPRSALATKLRLVR